MGQVLVQSRLIGIGDILIGCIDAEQLRQFGAATMDLEGIVDQLRVTEGVRIACFLHELPDRPEEFRSGKSRCHL